VCNQGQSASSSTDVVVQLGAETFSPGQPLAGMAPVPWLEPAACADVVVPVQSTGLFGEQTIIATVDPTRWGVFELIEDNNTSPAVLIGVGYDADLIVAAVSGPASAQPWTSLDVTARVCNQGQWDSYGARLDIVLSPDSRVDALDHVIATIPVPYLTRDACEDVTVPAQLLVYGGVYTLGAMVHPDNGPPELITSNNGAAGGTLAIGWDADLVITSVTGPATAVVGNELAIGVKVCNQGQGPSPATDVWALMSRDAIIDMGDAEQVPVTTAPLASLAPGSCELVSVPSFVYQPEGSYVLGAMVDPWSTAHELIESNNTGAGEPIEITID
jgi:hypothetical protein